MYGNRLKQLRNEKNWTIDDIAEKLDIGSSTYGGYETEYRKPPIETLTKIANIYNVSIDYILGLSDEKNIKEIEHNAFEYLKKNDLNWKGVPLSDEELKPIRDLLEVIVRDRLPADKINNE